MEPGMESDYSMKCGLLGSSINIIDSCIMILYCVSCVL